MRRAHLYTTVADENGVPYPWASLRVYAADGVTLFPGPIWVDAMGAAQRPNPFVVAPGIVDCYLERGARVVLGVSTVGQAERLTPPIDVPDSPHTLVYSPSPLLITGAPVGDAVLRYTGAAATWYSPSLGAHDHHGTAPLTAWVGPRNASEAASFEESTTVGGRDREPPVYYWTYDAITWHYGSFNRLQGVLYSTLSATFTPGASTDLRESATLGAEAIARGRGNVAGGYLAYAADDAFAGSDPGGIAFGARSVSHNGALVLGYRAAEQQAEVAESSHRIALGSYALPLDPDSIALGATSSAEGSGVALGYARAAPDQGVEIAGLLSRPEALSLPGETVVAPGDLRALGDLAAGPVGFHGAEAAERTAGLPGVSTAREPASGIAALDSLVYALRDLGLLADGVPHGIPAPAHWLGAALDALAGSQDTPGQRYLSCDEPGAPDTLTGQVLISDTSDLGFLPLLRTRTLTGGRLAGDYDLGQADPADYRVSLHALAAPEDSPGSGNRVGSVRLNNPARPPSLPQAHARDNTGTWNSAPVRLPAYATLRAVLTDADLNPVPFRDSVEVAPYAAEVVLIVDSTVLATTAWLADGDFIIEIPEAADGEPFDIELRALDGTTLAALHRALPEQGVSTLALMCLAFCERHDQAYRAREILRGLAPTVLDDPLPLADAGWLGLAVATYAEITGSDEFAELTAGLRTYLASLQDIDGSLAVEDVASTADNAIAALALRHIDPALAGDIVTALRDDHLRNGNFVSEFHPGTGTAVTTPDVWAVLLGSALLHAEGDAATARRALRALSGFRTGPELLGDGSTADGYALSANPAGAFDPGVTAAACLIRTALGEGNDNESIGNWLLNNPFDDARTDPESAIDYFTISWLALLGSGSTLS